ncbi:MAG: GlsB/YeaQ/YmgE family stress response membrane protein [Verrucomicrobiota bacterium]
MNNLMDLLLVGVVTGMIIGLMPGGRGFSQVRSILIGMVGAILGSFVYQQFLVGRLKLGLPSVTLSLNQLVIALLGAALLLGILHLVQKE